MGLAALAGSLMGITNMGNRLYSGVLKGPYALMSPAPDEKSLPILCFFVNMAIGVALSPAAVRVFGDNKAMFWRETAAGHSRIAYFVGQVLATLPRITLASLHFTCPMYILASPRGSFAHYCLIVFLASFCVYGLGGLVSAIAARKNASLVAVIVSLVSVLWCLLL